MAGIDPSLIWSAALLAAAAYAVHSARRSGLDARAMYWACAAAIGGGLYGSHLLGILVHGADGPQALLRVWQGGKSWFGGLFVGAFAAWLVLHRRGLPVRDYGEAAVPAVALGYGVARIGCFVNGDDYGALTSVPWAVRYGPAAEAHQAHVALGWIRPGDPWSLPVHPVQLYAAALGFALFLLLRAAPRRRLPLFASAYAIGRFGLEYLRGDFHPVTGPLSLPQCFCLILLAVAAWLSLSPRPAAEAVA